MPPRKGAPRGCRPPPRRMEPIPKRRYNCQNHSEKAAAMGIRFYCPNGHKLNVKSFQAGRNGICPYCGAKMQIPLESTRPSSRRKKSPAEEEETEIATEPAAMPAEAAASVEQNQNPSAAADSPCADDPLAVAGDVVWYVRPTSGGQFGPATAEIMRNWLAEGRIAAETLVWREGWRDWREAGGVFPQLSRPAAVPGLEEIPPAPISTPVHPRRFAGRSKDRTAQYAFIGGLALVVLVLFTILIIVLARQ
ncbi:MAG: DUF4339 domain-containing protein [Pirellulales bacterium]|nr:DUF4339 domain-containing protein [Pirellulales bacterium]